MAIFYEIIPSTAEILARRSQRGPEMTFSTVFGWLLGRELA